MAKGKPRPGRRVGVHRGACRCSKHRPSVHKSYGWQNRERRIELRARADQGPAPDLASSLGW